MKRYGVWLYHRGGCDYTIACGEKFVMLPESITSMEEAVNYVLTQDKEGCLPCHGRVEDCEIYEITNHFVVDVDAIHENANRLKAEAQKEERRKLFEELKEEFEP